MEATQCLRTARTIYRLRCTLVVEKVIKEQQGIFRGLLIGKSDNWIISQITKNHNAKGENYWQTVGKMYKTDMSHGMAALKNKSGSYFRNNVKKEILGKTS